MEKDALKRLYLQPHIRLLNLTASNPGGSLTRSGSVHLEQKLNVSLKKSSLIKNYSAAELYRAAHRKGLNCRLTSYSGCPQGHRRSQGHLQKLVRNVNFTNMNPNKNVKQNTNSHPHFGIKGHAGQANKSREDRSKKSEENGVNSKTVVSEQDLATGEKPALNGQDEIMLVNDELTMSGHPIMPSPWVGEVDADSSTHDLNLNTNETSACSQAQNLDKTLEIIERVKDIPQTPFNLGNIDNERTAQTEKTSTSRPKILGKISQKLKRSQYPLPIPTLRGTTPKFHPMPLTSLPKWVPTERRDSLRETNPKTRSKSTKQVISYRQKLNARKMKSNIIGSEKRPYFSQPEDMSSKQKSNVGLTPRPLSRSSMGIHVVRSRPNTQSNTDQWHIDEGIVPWGTRRPQSAQSNGIDILFENAKHDVYPTLQRSTVLDKRPASAKRRELMSKAKAENESYGHEELKPGDFTQRGYRRDSKQAEGTILQQQPSQQQQNLKGSRMRQDSIQNDLRNCSFVRIYFSISARLVTVNVSFEVNSSILKSSRNGWQEVEIADELLTCVRTTLERDAISVLEVSSMRHATIEWKRQDTTSQGKEHWTPLVSAKSMKDAIHNSFEEIMANSLSNEEPQEQDSEKAGLHIFLRVIPKRKLPRTDKQFSQEKKVINLTRDPKPVTLRVVDASSGFGKMQPPRPASRPSLSRGLMRSAVR